MAAYTAVISLLQTLDQPNISELFHDHSTEMLDSLRATAEYFQDVLENTSNEKIKSLEEDIRVAVSEAEDVVEMKISDMLPVVEKMDTTKKQVMEILSHDADQILELTADSLIGASSMSDPMLSGHLKDDIVQGLDGDLEIIDKRLRGPTSYLDIVTISGMGGIGKTTLAKKAYDHLPIRNVLLEALHCISKKNPKDYDEMNDNDLADLVQKSLKGPRYLVVVDDIWSRDVWDSISQIFPNRNNGSRVLLTTRETDVAIYANTGSPHKMNLLDLDNSWKLLRDKVFGLEHDHPPGLEEIGKKIAEKCQGLPLIISVIAGHLSKTVPKTLESWKYVAKTLSQIIASHPNKCLGLLGLSYHHLPNRLKPCFLSMGDFPEDFQVETWRLIQLWIAEGFIRTSSGSRESLEEVAKDYLEDLISRNLIMARKKRFNGEFQPSQGIGHLPCLVRLNCNSDYKVKSFEISPKTTLPRKIWMLKNLRYIRFGGATYLPNPRIDNNLVTGMPNLEEFYSICYSSCTNEVISSTPNLKRLIIRVPSSMPHNIPYRFLDMSSLTKLETFKFYWKGYLEDPIKIFIFPKSLRRLSLTRCCKFIWEEISSTFIMLPHLEELKLKHCLAKDDVWRLTDKDIFKSLKLLLLSELNLKGWEASSDNFPNLKRLVLKKCKHLQEIPTDFVEICTLESIELHDCTTTAEDSVRNIEQEREDMGYNILKVYIHNRHSKL
ncbi:hypothetical protein KY284_019250 [Solanum tuberosum]|nr:hypothetical protein KY284_019250 [Solanum tuberosum]